jgi:DNA-binding MarR family transcriptional regulator
MEPALGQLSSRPRRKSRDIAPGFVAGATSDRRDIAASHRQPKSLLLGVARQSGIGDPDSCRTILALLSVGRAIRRSLESELGPDELSEARFATLVTLYALEPLPATPTDLAYHADVTRSAMTDILDVLERRGWIKRGDPARDRRLTPIHLTELGCRITVIAVHRFLQAGSRLAGNLSLSRRKAIVDGCEQIERSIDHAASRTGQ